VVATAECDSGPRASTSARFRVSPAPRAAQPLRPCVSVALSLLLPPSLPPSLYVRVCVCACVRVCVCANIDECALGRVRSCNAVRTGVQPLARMRTVREASNECEFWRAAAAAGGGRPGIHGLEAADLLTGRGVSRESSAGTGPCTGRLAPRPCARVRAAAAAPGGAGVGLQWHRGFQ